MQIVGKIEDRSVPVRSHVTDTVLMVRPCDFAFNEQTASDNEFQHVPHDKRPDEINSAALDEFDRSVARLREAGIRVIVLEGEIHDNESRSRKPDAVFPNNWFSTHPDGRMTLYPMCTPNRREEVSRHVEVSQLLRNEGFLIEDVSALGGRIQDEEERFLEGTGSMVIDHLSGVVYAAKSVRTDEIRLEDFMQSHSKYYDKLISFDTRSSSGLPFYHTNVMMSIGESFAVVCSECIVEEDRERVLEELKKTKEVIDITLEQAERFFCGNILQLTSADGVRVIAMSESCLRGFTWEQLQALERHGRLVGLPVSETIEFVGGGSARCMIAEIFLPRAEPVALIASA